MLIYLQGGPGFESVVDYEGIAWAKYLLKFYKLLLIGSRGTGNSTLIDVISGIKHQNMGAYLQHFRADNIVKDCEAFRAYLIGRKKCYLLDQSYGGFTALTYLSFYPDALKGVFITGGLPPLPSYSVTEIYQRLLQNTVKVNEAFYRQIIHTQLYNKIIQVFDILKQQPYLLPDGGN